MKKRCSVCTDEKDLSSFRRDRSKKDGYQPSCKQCARERISQAYNSKYVQRVQERNKSIRAVNVEQINRYKASHPCVHCGETDVACLEFHHLDPTVKEFTIAQSLARKPYALLKEIEKCVMLCSNCHKKLHAGRFSLLP